LSSGNRYHIEVSGLSFQYPDGHAALRDVSFRIPGYEKVALVGANGSGKSTLLLHLNGILRAASGTVTICGMALNDSNLSRIRASVGLLFQNPDDQLFSLSVYEDVAFGPQHIGLPDAEIKTRVHRALDDVGMSGYAERMSHHMSMGEKKRVALATALSMQPPVLALDEPSAGLDPRGRRGFIEVVSRFDAQTVLISTHDMRLAAQTCSRVILLNAGQIVADGDAATILYDRGLMEQHGLETPD